MDHFPLINDIFDPTACTVTYEGNMLNYLLFQCISAV